MLPRLALPLLLVALPLTAFAQSEPVTLELAPPEALADDGEDDLDAEEQLDAQEAEDGEQDNEAWVDDAELDWLAPPPPGPGPSKGPAKGPSRGPSRGRCSVSTPGAEGATDAAWLGLLGAAALALTARRRPAPNPMRRR